MIYLPAQDKYKKQKSENRQITNNSEIDEQHPGKRIIMSSVEHHTVTDMFIP